MAEATAEQVRAQQLIESLWLDGKLGPELHKKAKELFPDIRTPSDSTALLAAQMEERFSSKFDEQAKELERLRAERAAEKAETEKLAAEKQKVTYEQQINAARDAYNLTEEGFDKMVARMKETGNYTDPESAAAWVASKTPPKPVSGPAFGPQDLNLFGSSQQDEKMAALHRDPQRYMDMELTEFVRDPDKYVRETFGGR